MPSLCPLCALSVHSLCIHRALDATLGILSVHPLQGLCTRSTHTLSLCTHCAHVTACMHLLCTPYALSAHCMCTMCALTMYSLCTPDTLTVHSTHIYSLHELRTLCTRCLQSSGTRPAIHVPVVCPHLALRVHARYTFDANTSLYPHCSRFAHFYDSSLCTPCAVTVYAVCSPCAHNDGARTAPYTQRTLCTLLVYSQRTHYALTVHWLCPKYVITAHPVYTHSTHAPTRCKLSECWVHSLYSHCHSVRAHYILPVHFALDVRSLCTHCALTVYCHCTVSAPSVHSLRTLLHSTCTLCALTMYVAGTLCAVTMFSVTAYLLCTDCAHIVPSVWLLCALIAHALHTFCALMKHCLCTQCTFRMHSVVAVCALTRRLLCTLCALTVSHCAHTLPPMCLLALFHVPIACTHCALLVHSPCTLCIFHVDSLRILAHAPCAHRAPVVHYRST